MVGIKYGNQRCCVALVIVLIVWQSADAGHPTLELTVGDARFTGRPLAYNDDVCWLIQPDGRLNEISLKSVSAHRKVSDDFQGLTTLDARNELRQELGRGWEIVGTGHYLVAAHSGDARRYASHFEELYRSFRSYFSKRGFELPEPDFPLIAVVFASPQEFVDQCHKDDMPPVKGLRGYYHRRTNRINLFETKQTAVIDDTALIGTDLHANIQASLKETIVHEATHQVAFNLGLHSRIGQTPRWVIEGLATMFEAEGTRQNTGGKHAADRVNPERLHWFVKYREQQRQPGSLVRFISSETLFNRSPLDFYAEAWAITFFLAETRPQQYTDYLKLVAAHDPLKPYSPIQRISDFQSAFGSDLARLEVDMLRFVDGLDLTNR